MRRERLVRPTILKYFIELIETSVASVVYAYKHTPPVARSNKSFWICSDNRTPPRVSNITLHHACAIGGKAYFNICAPQPSRNS